MGLCCTCLGTTGWGVGGRVWEQGEGRGRGRRRGLGRKGCGGGMLRLNG